MSEFLIYGKVTKSCALAQKPFRTFKVLNYQGVPVNRLAQAESYATKEDAQEKIDKALERLQKMGLRDCVEFQIRKAK